MQSNFYLILNPIYIKMKTQKKRHLISRRDFISRTAISSAALAFLPLSTVLAKNPTPVSTWPKNASKYKFYMIGHGHIDPVWLWRWSEGVSVVLSTFRSALDRMNESSEMVFTCSSAQLYQWVAENDPQMLNEIRERVKEGRWNIVGGWWIEPDMNIPSGEAMVRQGLYGQLTFQRLLGCRATVGFNPDSFGHTSTLPQILKQQGMDNYVFMRPAPYEKTIPSDLFWWEGTDGTRVLTYRIQHSYNEMGDVRKRVGQILEGGQKEPFNSFMAFYGVGDHGGGPTKENLQSIEGLRVEKGAPVIKYGSVDRYFEEMRADKKLNLPIVKDDLQHHAVGCYTAESEIKKNNRKSEAALVTSEKINAIGSAMWQVNYPKEKYTSAWHKLLFLQFHDSLAGTSLHAHSQDAREGYGYTLDVANESAVMALQKLEWQIASEDPKSEYMVVFNPHAWEVDTAVEYDIKWWRDPEKSVVIDDEGNTFPYQLSIEQASLCDWRRRLLFNVKVPAMGYRQVRLMLRDTPYTVENPVKAENNTIENEFYRVSFSSNGTIKILDKKSGKEVFSNGNGGCRAVVIDDPSDTWSHGIKSYKNEIGAFGNATFKVLETGPYRATIRVISTYGDSKLTIDWSLYSNSKNIEAKVSLNWNERLKMLKFSFPVAVDTPKATYETPYGYIERLANGDEDPGQRWIDVSGSNSGLTILNDAKYGYSIEENDMRISVVRSAVFAHHDPYKLEKDKEYIWMDQGIQTFNMLLIPHEGSWQEAGIPRIAEEFISPLLTIYQGIHPGKMPKSGSFLSVDAQNIVVSSVKKSEEGNDFIIRCVETTGKSSTASVDILFAQCKWKGDFQANEIKTLRVDPKAKSVKEVNLLEE